MLDSPHQVVVVGSTFAPLTAALQLRKHIGQRHQAKRSKVGFERILLSARKRGRVVL